MEVTETKESLPEVETESSNVKEAVKVIDETKNNKIELEVEQVRKSKSPVKSNANENFPVKELEENLDDTDQAEQLAEPVLVKETSESTEVLNESKHGEVDVLKNDESESVNEEDKIDHVKEDTIENDKINPEAANNAQIVEPINNTKVNDIPETEAPTDDLLDQEQNADENENDEVKPEDISMEEQNILSDNEKILEDVNDVKEEQVHINNLICVYKNMIFNH